MPNHSAAQAVAPAEAASPELDFYRTRDRLNRAYAPATEQERLLLEQMTRAWLQLEEAYRFRAEILKTRSLIDLFNNDLPRYKLLNRAITDAERLWRYALEEFRRARRDNPSTAPRKPRTRVSPRTIISLENSTPPTSPSPPNPDPRPSTPTCDNKRWYP